MPPSPRLTVPCGWGPVPLPGPSRPPRWSRPGPQPRPTQRPHGGDATGMALVRSPGPTGSGLPGALGSEADWLTNDMTQLQDGAWRHGRPTQRHMGKEDPVRASGRKDPERSRERVKTSCAGQVEMKAEGPQRSEVGVDVMVRVGERARLTHGTQTRGRGEIGRRRGTGRSSPYRVFGGPTSLEAGSQGGGDSPKCGFLFRVGLCSTTLSILK